MKKAGLFSVVAACSWTSVFMTGCQQPYDNTPALQGEFQGMVQGYRVQAEQLARAEKSSYAAKDLPAVPSQFVPPAQEMMSNSMGGTPHKYKLEDLYVDALAHSSQIRVFSDIPLIRETGIQEAKGPFDTNLFLESKYEKTNLPSGSILTTGGPSRLLEDETSVGGGVRKKFVTGTEVTLSQEFAHLNSNSIYVDPDPQNTAELTLRVVQPLLRGAGCAYNTATLRVAQIDSEIARKEFVRQTESQLLEVSRAYWGLYLARAVYYSKRRMVGSTGDIVKELTDRGEIDAIKRQVLRARAAYETRKSDLIRSEAAVRNAQDRLMALVNDPVMRESSSIEIVPGDTPIMREMTADVRLAAATALEQRPEISQGFMQLKAAAVREKMQRNEVLPSISIILQGSLAGLSGDNRYSQSYENQYSTGGPGYIAGLQGEIPLENNEANARLERRKLELRQQFSQLQTTVETVLLEVKVSVREVKTSYRDIQAKYASYLASKEEVDNLFARKGVILTSEDVSATTYLESILTSQDRLAGNEEDFLKSVAAYNVALTNQQKAQGTLLSYEKVNMKRTKDADGLPVLELQKAGARPSQAPPTRPPLVSDLLAEDATPKSVVNSIAGTSLPAAASTSGTATGYAGQAVPSSRSSDDTAVAVKPVPRTVPGGSRASSNSRMASQPSAMPARSAATTTRTVTASAKPVPAEEPVARPAAVVHEAPAPAATPAAPAPTAVASSPTPAPVEQVASHSASAPSIAPVPEAAETVPSPSTLPATP